MASATLILILSVSEPYFRNTIYKHIWTDLETGC